MRLLLISLLIIACISYESAAVRTGTKQRYAKFKQRFGKKSDDKLTEEKRMEKFEKNCDLIDKQNEKFINGESLFTVDVNDLSASLDSELKNLKGFVPPPAQKLKRAIGTQRMIARQGGTVFYPYHASATAPNRTANDWRTVWNKAIDDQGDCGSCWAWASATVVDAIYRIKKNITINTSEQEMIDCSGSYGTQACNGGSQLHAFEYVANQGVGAESTYPYIKAKSPTCKKVASPNYKINSFVVVDKSEEALRQAIDELGPCTVSIDVDDPLFMQYKSGIYSSTVCSNVPNQADHAVVVVGYGRENNVDFWIVRNTWGARWGDQGYIRIRRNANNLCGITNWAYCAILN